MDKNLNTELCNFPRRFLVTGLTTLHWGRMEFGNAGNYYIAAPFFRELQRAFPGAKVQTTLQFSDEFVLANGLSTVPMDSYYAWRDDRADLEVALQELALATIYHETGTLSMTTTFMDAVLESDTVLFFHGDMWGDNADANGKDRFFVDVLKVRIAQLMGRKTAMIASSPGPVTHPQTLELAKAAYKELTVVINREARSRMILENAGFDVSRTYDFVCPAFLFSSEYYPEAVDSAKLLTDAGIAEESGRRNIGVIPSTYSISGGAFDQWTWESDDFESFLRLIEYIITTTGDNVILIPHAYGFERSPRFRQVHWRDYKMLCEMYDILKRRGNIDMQRLIRLDAVLLPWESHALLGRLSMLVSGRVHGAVGALSQHVPTIAISYRNGPLEHKMLSFFETVGMSRCVVPRGNEDFTELFNSVYADLAGIREQLRRRVPEAQARARQGFDFLRHALAD